MIAEEIGALAVQSGWESWIAYGREPHREPSASKLLRIGTDTDMKVHGVQSRLLDNHGLASKAATRRFIAQLREIQPDLIHLHNIHGYYLNYPLLFEYLREWGGPVVWTLHDIWPITGHCAYFGVNECPKWRTGCGKCPNLKYYPTSFGIDRSNQNWKDKKNAFTSLNNLTIVTVSNWLAEQAKSSFLGNFPIRIIHNGVDLSTFYPSTKTTEKNFIIAVSNVWTPEKGFNDILELRKMLQHDIDIIMVGVSERQKTMLPQGIIGITRTNDRETLRQLYAEASALINPTYGDTFALVNAEALACGTPVITYRTGGSPEVIDEKTGIVVEQGDIIGLVNAIDQAANLKREDCRKRAEECFNKDDRFAEYISTYASTDYNRGGYVMAISNVWNREKGFDDILALRKVLPQEIGIVMVGVSEEQQKVLPHGIHGVRRTADREELRKLYAKATSLINCTYGDNFPTVNIEALACGTPVITYRTGGSPEAIDEKTGIVVEQDDIVELVKAIDQVANLKREDCRKRAEERFNKDDRFAEYLALYESVL